jgi:hypothetical protein
MFLFLSFFLGLVASNSVPRTQFKLSKLEQYGDLTNNNLGVLNNARIVNFGPGDASFYTYVYVWFNNQKFNNAWFKTSEFILAELRKRATWKTTFDLIGEEFSVIKTNTTCYKMVNACLQNTACGTYNDWTRQYSKNVANICFNSVAADVLFTLDVICDYSAKEVNLTIQPNTIYTIYNSSNSAHDLFQRLVALV